MAKTITRHQFTTNDPPRGKHYPQCCIDCGLPEANQAHTLRPVSPETRQAEQRRYAEKD